MQTPATVPASGNQQGGGALDGGATVPVTMQPETIDPAVIPPSGVLTPGAEPAQGDATPIIPSDDESSDVPEPQSLAIIGAGLAVMGLARRRRRTA